MTATAAPSPHHPDGRQAGLRPSRRFGRGLRVLALVALAAAVSVAAALAHPPARGPLLEWGCGTLHRVQAGWYVWRLGAGAPIACHDLEVLVAPGLQSAVDSSGRPQLKPSLAAQGEWVAGAAAAALGRIDELTGLSVLPATLPRIVVYPNAEEMARLWGWPAGRGAHGAYWPGAVQVVTPCAWLDCGPDGPSGGAGAALLAVLGHELTHWAFEGVTSGRIPRWLSEGLAQRAEERLLGSEAPVELVCSRARAAGRAAIDRFAGWFLVRGASAAEERQAYLLARSVVAYLDVHFPAGWEDRLVAGIRECGSFAAAFGQTTGLTLAEFERRWEEWLWP